MSARGGSTRGRAVVGPTATQAARRDAGPVTVKGQERRETILIAARRVFERLGYVDARVADIVKEAKVAQGTFYTYFDSKEAVFTELAKQVTTGMLETLKAERASGTPRERVRHGLHRFVLAFRPNATFQRLLEQVGTSSPEMSTMRLALREDFVRRSARGIEHMQEEGFADPSIDPVMVAEVLGAMVDQTTFMWLSLGKEYDEDELLDTLTLVWSRAIGLKEQ
ncbi:TetR/AcrR family transcriptional regulator [Nocardioides sp. LHD-245]|uniref:TetR/AcrR family transcriptional regulator n=1 Tax=Nocardioides sp. LHD-245 TaxID=3051387 RepID=UPI0027DFD754|nr:TetR/AcrR family transcriptional regulator [Nocardioides sp. LHD-245]